MVKRAKASKMCTITAETTLLLLLVAVHIATYPSEKNVHWEFKFRYFANGEFAEFNLC